MKDKILFELYKKMRRIEAVEDAIAERYYGDIRPMHTPIHLYNGQEAIAVGVCENLEQKDMVFSNHRCHGHYMAKGGNLNTMIAELYSKKTGCCKGKGGSMHLCDIEAGVSLASGIVAGNVSISTGYAMGNKLKNNSHISCVFFGDGASEEGSVYESISFAKLHNLPILFVCENNLYAINTPFKAREPLSQISEKFSSILPDFVYDGNDIEEVYYSAKELIQTIRNGNGPVLVEYNTYRTKDHSNVGTGINLHTRTKEEWQTWEKKNPIEQAKASLLKTDSSYQELIEGYEQILQEEIDKAFSFAEESPFPEKEALWENMWGNKLWSL